jgi:hypothetical protein
MEDVLVPRRTSLLVASFSSLVLLFSLSLATASAAHHPGAHILMVELTGEAEVPGPGDPDATGTVAILVVPAADLICYQLTWQNIDGTVFGAHIHEGAEDEAGPIVVTLFGGPLGPSTAFSGTGSFQSCTRSAEADDIAENPGNYYVNIHSDVYPGGAIRGQLA